MNAHESNTNTFKDLSPRIKTAVLMSSVFALLWLLAFIWPWGRQLLGGVGLIIFLGCSWEYSRLCNLSESHKVRGWVYLILCLTPLIIFSAKQSGIALSLELALLLSLLSVVTFGQTGLNAAGDVARDSLIGITLIGLGGTSLLYMSQSRHGLALMLCLVLSVAINDSVAYFAGRKWGSAKISPYLSPNKTSIGSLSGLISGTVSGALLSLLFVPSGSILTGLLLFLCVSVMAQVADLAKSLIKRIYSVKDSGSLLPGHGGLIDRLDGILGGAIVLQVFMVWSN